MSHPMQTTDETHTEHTCPDCGSHDVWAELDNMDDATGDVHMMCEDCGKFFWTDAGDQTANDSTDEDNNEDTTESDDSSDDWRTMTSDECKRQNGLTQENGVLWSRSDS